MNAVTSFCCDFILDVHIDIITSEMMLGMTQPAVKLDTTFIFFISEPLDLGVGESWTQ